MSLIHKVEETVYDYSNGSRQVIAEFILNNRSSINKHSIQDIANMTFTSKATVVRFAKTMGFSGWLEFIKAFMEEQKHQEAHYSDIDPNYPFTESSSTADIINQICSLQVESILDTADLLDKAPIDDCVQLLYSAKRIAMFGLNPHLSIAQLFVRKMLSIGKSVETSPVGDVGLLAASLDEDDCAIILSYSGNMGNKPPMNILPILRDKKVPIIGITSSGDNLLSREVTYTIPISSRERLYSKVATFATENAMLYVLNILFSCYFVMEYEKNLKFKVERSSWLEHSIRFSLSPDIDEKDENSGR